MIIYAKYIDAIKVLGDAKESLLMAFAFLYAFVKASLRCPRSDLPGRIWLSCMAFIFATMATEPKAQPQYSFVPNLLPNLRVVFAEGPIEIDGLLDDPGWKNASIAVNFSTYGLQDLKRPPADTRVMVTYNRSFLYLGIIAYDDPRNVHASWRDRDKAWDDDQVGIILDPFGQGDWAYKIMVNPFGIQMDSRYSHNNDDISFDIKFNSRGMKTDSGYQVEIAIPFNQMRYPESESHTWRVTFWRERPRNFQERYSWAAIDINDPCFLCQLGYISGIDNITPPRYFNILPSFVAYQSALREESENAALRQNDPRGRLSLDVRYVRSPNETYEISLRPDFSQIESDPGLIDINSTFAMYYQEKRPFFQEGADLLQWRMPIIYTRSINDPEVSLKVIKRFRRTAISCIAARDIHSPMAIPLEEGGELISVGRSYSAIFRLRHSLSSDSYLGTMAAFRSHDGGGHGANGGIDGEWWFHRNYALGWLAVFSTTREPIDSLLILSNDSCRFGERDYTGKLDGESFQGHGLNLSFKRESRVWNFDLNYQQKSPTFRAENGFVISNDTRNLRLWAGPTIRPSSSFFLRIRPTVSAGQRWNYAGIEKGRWVNLRLLSDIIGPLYLGFGQLWEEERFHCIWFRNIRQFETSVSSDANYQFKFGFDFRYGNSIARNVSPPRLGRGYEFDIWLRIKLMSRIFISPDCSFSKLDDIDGPQIFRGYIFRGKQTLQLSRNLSARVVAQYNSFGERVSIEPLLTYKINAVSLIYLGYSREIDISAENGVETESIQYFAKFQIPVL